MLASNWKTILKEAWSVRFMAVAIFFASCEAILPMFIEKIPPKLFICLTILFISLSFVSRFVYQNNLSCRLEPLLDT